jgi:hypothetical protein
VQDEWIDVGAKLGDNEGHAMCHQTTDEVDIARQPVELADDHWPFGLACHLDRGGEPAVEGVGALPNLVLLEGAGDLEIFGLGEAGDRLCLRGKPVAAPSLPLGRDRDPNVGDRWPETVSVTIDPRNGLTQGVLQRSRFGSASTPLHGHRNGG